MTFFHLIPGEGTERAKIMQENFQLETATPFFSSRGVSARNRRISYHAQHIHWFEFNYVLSGQLGTRFDGDEITVREGEFSLIPPGRVHSHTYTRGNPHEELLLPLAAPPR